MSSVASFGKKPALCRYFAVNGTCFYGSECQFLHENPRGRKFTGLNHSPNSSNTADGVGGDGNNGDQFFSATFGASNGIPEFQPFPSRPKAAAAANPLAGVDTSKMNNSKAPLYAASFSSIDDSPLTDQMAALSMSNPLQAKSRTSGPAEFVPKSSTATQNNNIGLTHSASTPSFSNNCSQGPAPTGSGLGPAASNAQTAIPHAQGYSTAASPMDSPRLSPTGSPMVHHRNSSPAPPANSTSSANAALPRLDMALSTMQESVGGTTYFYTKDDLNSQTQGVVLPSFTMYPSILPHVAHMRPKANMPSFFVPDEMKLELLNRHAIMMAQIDPEQNPDIPTEVDNYHNLFPLEPPPGPMHKSNTFGYQTTVYKATNTKDGLTYCLRRIHGYRLMNTKNSDLWKCIDMWKKMQHSNTVQLREVFTTKAFGDHSMVFVYDFHPAAETLMFRHFTSQHHANGFSGGGGGGGGGGGSGGSYRDRFEGPHRPYSSDKGKGMNGPRQHAGLLAESLVWTYVVQLTSALRTIHAHGLACRVMDPTKILLTDKSRIRLNCVGIFDVLSFDSSQASPLAVIPHYQQEDLVSLGKVTLALACNSISGIHRDRIQASMELVARNYSSDLKNLILYLLSNQNRMRSINDVMPMIGARFYTQLDAAQLRSDVLENELGKEVENSRLFRLVSKLGIINERPEFHLDPTWSETGDRYMLKLFRDYVFHQVDENGSPWVDMAHIVQCFNKLDSGSPEKLCLMSRDEQSVLVVTYAELKQCFESAFTDLLTAASSHSTFS